MPMSEDECRVLDGLLERLSELDDWDREFVTDRDKKRKYDLSEKQQAILFKRGRKYGVEGVPADSGGGGRAAGRFSGGSGGVDGRLIQVLERVEARLKGIEDILAAAGLQRPVDGGQNGETDPVFRDSAAFLSALPF